MASSKHSEDLGTREATRSSQFDEELQTLESDVNRMAQQILEYRASLPDQLKTTLASVLAAQRPIVPDISDSVSSEAPNSDAAGPTVLIGGKSLALDNPETAKKVQLIKEKISSNASAMAAVLKRMKDCIAKIEKLDSYNVTLHPAFQRKKTR